MKPTLNALIPATLALALAVVSGSVTAPTGSTNAGISPGSATNTEADIRAINIHDQIKLAFS